MNQTWENGKKPSFKPDFGPFVPKLCCQKNNSRHENLAPSVTRYDGQLSSCAISEKQKWQTRVISYDTFRLTSSIQKLSKLCRRQEIT